MIVTILSSASPPTKAKRCACPRGLVLGPTRELVQQIFVVSHATVTVTVTVTVTATVTVTVTVRVTVTVIITVTVMVIVMVTVTEY